MDLFNYNNRISATKLWLVATLSTRANRKLRSFYSILIDLRVYKQADSHGTKLSKKILISMTPQTIHKCFALHITLHKARIRILCGVIGGAGECISRILVGRLETRRCLICIFDPRNVWYRLITSHLLCQVYWLDSAWSPTCPSKHG